MSTVRFAEDGALGVVTLDSPPRNLIGEAVIGDLVAAVDRIEASDGLRGVLVRGEGWAAGGGGTACAAGADVSRSAGRASGDVRSWRASFRARGRRLEPLPFPT